MRLIVLPALLLAVPAFAAEPRLDRVTLSSAGVGQYEFTAHLDGPGHVALEAPLDQVDDLLASLRIDDPAGGAVTVQLPGRQPIAEAFRTLPIGEAALASPEALLQALVGAEVRLPGAGISGAILSVTPTETQLPNGGGVITRHRLAVATASGVASVVLEDQPEVVFASATLRAQLAAALAAIADHRTQDRRTLDVDLPGTGGRDVRLGYVVSAPVWKASYRLTLPADGPARLQGFAVVENLSGQDWRGVQVVLTSGQPVLFHQPLYEAVFTERPDAPVQVANHLTPRADEGAQPAAIEAPAPAPPPGAAFRAMAAPVAKSVSAPEPVEAVAEQVATQVEFRLTAPVDAASGQSLLLPILDRTVPTRRVALVTPETDGVHPFVALQVTNDAGAALPPGLATLYREDAGAVFVGNALLPAMQPGEDRLLSFASDLSTRVTKTESGDSAIVSGHAARGMLVLTWRDRNTTTYRVTTAPGEARTVLIEQPRRDGWTLTQPGGGQTPSRWRVSQDVPGGTTQDITLVTERPRSQSVLVSSLSPALLLEYAGNAELDPAARAAFAHVGELRAELDRRSAAVAALARQMDAIVADQERVRANLASTAQNQALQTRYTAMLQQQEDELAALRAQQAAAQAGVETQEAALKDALAGLSF